MGTSARTSGTGHCRHLFLAHGTIAVLVEFAETFPRLVRGFIFRDLAVLVFVGTLEHLRTTDAGSARTSATGHCCHLFLAHGTIAVLVEFAEPLPRLGGHFVFGDFAIVVLVCVLEELATARLRSSRNSRPALRRTAFGTARASAHHFLHRHFRIAILVEFAEPFPAFAGLRLRNGLVAILVHVAEKGSVTFSSAGSFGFFRLGFGVFRAEGSESEGAAEEGNESGLHG